MQKLKVTQIKVLPLQKNKYCNEFLSSIQKFDKEGWQWDPCRWEPRLPWLGLPHLERGRHRDQGAHLWVRGDTEILNIKYEEVSQFLSAWTIVPDPHSWLWELVIRDVSPRNIRSQISLSMKILRHLGHGRSTKSKATGMNCKSSCLWLGSFRH